MAAQAEETAVPTWKTDVSMVQFLLKEVMAGFGAPEEIDSDHKSHYRGQVLKR